MGTRGAGCAGERRHRQAHADRVSRGSRRDRHGGCRGAGRRLHRARDGSRGAAGRVVVQRHGGHRVRAEVPARPALSPPDRARRRAAGDSDRARTRAGVRSAGRSDRHDGLLGRRTPDVHRRHALRRRQAGRRRSHRSGEQPAGFPDPRVSGGVVRSGGRAYGIEEGPARREPRSEAGRGSLERSARHAARRRRRSCSTPTPTPGSCPRTACGSTSGFARRRSRRRCTSSRTVRTASASRSAIPR